MQLGASPTARALLALELLQGSPGITAERLAGRALGKILRALPEPVAAQAEAVRRATAPAPDRAAVRPDQGIAASLVQACSQHQHVRLDYTTEAGSQWQTEVEPWAVVVRHGRWYLLCRRPSTDNVRAYRIDRVCDVQSLDTTFEPPSDLDAVALLETHLATGWEYETEVVIDAPFDVLTPCVPRTLGRLEVVDATTTRLVGSTSNPQWYAEQLAAIPASFRIVGGPEVQRAAGSIGARLVAAATGMPKTR